MATLSEQFTALNDADLSKLRAKLDGMRADLAAALETQGKKGSDVATESDIKAAAGKAGVSVEDLLAALEAAKRRGLI